ncbi:hypothetical protein J1N35_028669 [Gossypium stocksii]|uniref:Uncharacterized protein n=1 Tax=Gossypium stocksii TaxID=47602 RepID=A0A9D3ZSL5_9ROSI|nr:hypothetical protein J1N35_028669 [Gossypium stocksii]
MGHLVWESTIETIVPKAIPPSKHKEVWKQVDGFMDFFALCNNVKMAEIRKCLRLISIAIACGTMWLARNGLVFDGRRVHMENLVFQSKMTALLWIRSVHDEIMLQENFWWISPQRCRVVSYISKPVASFWRPLPLGWLKFNVCGIAKDDKAGCEGVLRDMKGVARGIFSGVVAINVADEAEIGAVKVTLEVFLAMSWETNDSLFIELGSFVVFSWCVNKVLRPWSLHAIFPDFKIAKLKVGSVVFSLADRNGNDMAFPLVMAGVNRPQVFKAWW